MFELNNVKVIGCGRNDVDLPIEEIKTITMLDAIRVIFELDDIKIAITRDIIFELKDNMLIIDVKQQEGISGLFVLMTEVLKLREENAQLRKKANNPKGLDKD